MGTSGESAGSAKVAVVGGWEKVCICNCGLSRLPFYPPAVYLEYNKSGSCFSNVWGRRARFLSFVVVGLL
jgi:hypothetical protein